MHDYTILQGKNLQISNISLNCINREISMTIQTDIENKELLILFSNVSFLNLRNISYPMIIECFDIIDNSNRGWDSQVRYHIHDLEDETIDFYCQDIRTL